MSRKFMTTGMIAKICKVTPNAVIKWTQSGKLPAFKTPGGQRRVKEEDFRAFLRTYDFPVNRIFESELTVLLIGLDPQQVKFLRELFGTEYRFETTESTHEACLKIGRRLPDSIFVHASLGQERIHEFLLLLSKDSSTKDISFVVLGDGSQSFASLPKDVLNLSLDEKTLKTYFDSISPF